MVAAVFPVVCAWCRKEMGTATVADSHGICPACFEKVLGVPNLSESDLANLPFGVITVDAAGTILAYNPSEEELSHRSAGTVLGRSFFTDVAPCTAVREFEGRFREFLAGDETSTDFEFTFSFDHGARRVLILFLKSGEGEATLFVVVKATDAE